MLRIIRQSRQQLRHEVAAELSKADIAELSPNQISRMTNDELAAVVHTVRMSFMPANSFDHLQFMDREALIRLVFLARRTCRNQGY